MALPSTGGSMDPRAQGNMAAPKPKASPPPTVTRTYTGNQELRPPTKPKPAAERTYTGKQDQTKGGTNGKGATTAAAAAAAAKSAAAAAAAKNALAWPPPPKGTPLVNDPLHPASESTFMYGRDGVSLTRGMIMRTQDKAGETDSNGRPVVIPFDRRYRFRFLYNPETISYSTNVFAGRIDPGFQNPDAKLQARFIGQETVSFGLMLDRTQEAYEQGIKTRGTLPDIEALYRVVNGNSGLKTGFLYLSSVEIHWGIYGPGIASHALPPFKGYITSINLEHTKFSPRMCPIRTVVSISAARIAETDEADRATSLFGDGKGVA